MAILIERTSLVIQNQTLRDGYPGGVGGFALDCPNGSFCTDRLLSRVSFINPKDINHLVSILEECGLSMMNHTGRVYRDFALVDQKNGPLHDAPRWLRFGRDHDGCSICWTTEEAIGTRVVPQGWTRDNAIHPDDYLSYREFEQNLEHINFQENEDWFRLRETGDLVSISRAYAGWKDWKQAITDRFEGSGGNRDAIEVDVAKGSAPGIEKTCPV